MPPRSPAPTDSAASTERSRWLVEEVQAHESAVRGYLRSQFPSVDTDDVIQESYLKLLRARAVDSIQSTRAYFFSIARNTALTLFRRGKFFVEPSVNELPESSVLDPAPNAAESADHRQRIDLAVEAIDRLPRACREIVKRLALQGMSTEEVARELGLSPSTVRVQLARGLRKCAEYLENEQRCR